MSLPDGATARLRQAAAGHRRAAPLTLPGADPRACTTCAPSTTATRLKATLSHGARVVVIGAGWIGLEVAAAARAAGAEVTVLEMAEQPLLACSGREIGRVFADLHRDHGVDLRARRRRSRGSRRDDGAASGVRLADGTHVPADVVIVGDRRRAQHRAGRARRALDVDDGVLVDAALRTSDPDIFAVGDVANAAASGAEAPDARRALGQRPQPARRRGRRDARAGDRRTTKLPYFFTDQYDLGMEYIGLAPAATTTSWSAATWTSASSSRSGSTARTGSRRA